MPRTGSSSSAQQRAAPAFETVRKVRRYEQVAEQIRKLIASGALKAGDKLPSERDLCRPPQRAPQSGRRADGPAGGEPGPLAASAGAAAALLQGPPPHPPRHQAPRRQGGGGSSPQAPGRDRRDRDASALNGRQTKWAVSSQSRSSTAASSRRSWPPTSAGPSCSPPTR